MLVCGTACDQSSIVSTFVDNQPERLSMLNSHSHSWMKSILSFLKIIEKIKNSDDLSRIKCFHQSKCLILVRIKYTWGRLGVKSLINFKCDGGSTAPMETDSIRLEVPESTQVDSHVDVGKFIDKLVKKSVELVCHTTVGNIILYFELFIMKIVHNSTKYKINIELNVDDEYIYS